MAGTSRCRSRSGSWVLRSGIEGEPRRIYDCYRAGIRELCVGVCVMAIRQQVRRAAGQSAEPRRCSIRDPTFGLCHLLADHDGPHAVYLGGEQCITWMGADKSKWRVHPPPPWLVDRPWAPGHGLPLA